MDTRKFNNKKEWRNFGFGLAGIVILIMIIQLFLKHEFFWSLLVISLLLLLFSLLVPVVLKPLYIIFSYIGLVFGWIMTRFTITLLFYLVLTPIGLMAKIFGKKFLDIDFKKKRDSYWKEVSASRIDKSSYEKQF
jgi:predicted membrane protein